MVSSYLVMCSVVPACLTCVVIPFLPPAGKSRGGFVFVTLNGLTSISAVQPLPGRVLTLDEKKYKEIERATVFPSGRTYQSTYGEFFESKEISKISNRVVNFMSYFSFIRNGQVQMYILYGSIFIALLTLCAFLNML
ncbi:MAG TPA: hypothetical protein VFW11_21780 [Cyclobacteriaceae bacterium]|nr:hypothetical protein [Cyclobacteriaceae bacterium]